MAHDHASTGGKAVVAHHFESLAHQQSSASLCMWVFLATEAMMFGGLGSSVLRFVRGFGSSVLVCLGSRLLIAHRGAFIRSWVAGQVQSTTVGNRGAVGGTGGQSAG